MVAHRTHHDQTHGPGTRPEQGRQSLAILDAELQWLDGLLADGRPYLSGSQCSRADLTAAALLGPMVVPKVHPMVHAIGAVVRYHPHSSYTSCLAAHSWSSRMEYEERYTDAELVEIIDLKMWDRSSLEMPTGLRRLQLQEINS